VNASLELAPHAPDSLRSPCLRPSPCVLVQRAQHNEERGFRFPLYVLDFAMVMQVGL